MGNRYCLELSFHDKAVVCCGAKNGVKKKTCLVKGKIDQNHPKPVVTRVFF